MALEQHTIAIPTGATPALTDRTIIGSLPGVANPAGSAAGASVAVAVAFGNELPADYGVYVNPGQAAGWWISGKSNTGFTVNLIPIVSTAILAAGTFDVLVVA